MKAAVLTEYGKVQWKDVPDVHAGEDQVLVKVRFASICGSDMHIFHGDFHPRTKLPLICGHEFAGTVAEVGNKVSEFSIGQQVTVDPIIWCGKCPACREGHYPACSSLKLVGVDLDGGFAEFVAVDKSMVFAVDQAVPAEHAALVEVLGIGFHACNRAKVTSNSSLAIWGAGRIGQCVLQAARTRTDKPVFMIDLLDQRLKIAESAYDNVFTVNPLRHDPVEFIKSKTSGEGVDIAIEAVGHAGETDKTVNPVMGCVRSIRGAGNVCVLGLSDVPAEIVFKELIWKEATIAASRVSAGEFDESIDCLSKGKLKPEILISDVYPANKVQQAFEILQKSPHEHLKILLDMGP